MRKITTAATIVTSITLALCAKRMVSQVIGPKGNVLLTKTQQDTCKSKSIPENYCIDLVRIKEPSFRPLLDDPSGDPQALGAFLAPLVLEDTFVQRAKSQLSPLLQNALQRVSTGGNVNQAGSPGANTGSTNLVAKPTTTDFLSLASETGAFTDTVNGSSATIQANALGLVKYLNGVPVFGYWNATGVDILQHLNFSATLGLTQSGSTTAKTTGSPTNDSLASLTSLFVPTNNATLSSFGATYVVYRRFNPQNEQNVGIWKNAVKANKSKLQTDTVAIEAAVDKFVPNGFVNSESMESAVHQWNNAALADLALADPGQQFESLAQDYAVYLLAYEKALMAQTNALANADAFLIAVDTFESGVRELVDQARGKPIATFGYTYTPSAQKPATHSFTGSLAYSFAGKKKPATQANPLKTSMLHLSGAQLTANLTAVIFAKVPAGAAYGRLQDYQASGEFDLPIGTNTLKPIATFSIAGYGQYQDKPTVLNISAANLLPGTNIMLPANAQSYLGTAGWTEVAQGKIVVNLKQGLSVPLAVKWSNKTDLLQANEVRGQIGISYDLSALSSLIKGGN